GVERLEDPTDLAVHHPARANDGRAGGRLGHRQLAVGAERGVIVDHLLAPGVRAEDTAVAVVGELVEARIRHHQQVVADLVAHGGERPVEDPVRRGAATAGGVLVLVPGAPNSMIPPSPASAAAAASRRSESTVCCETPGREEIARGSSIPSATNAGRTNCCARREVSDTNLRIAGVVRRRRGRTTGPVSALTGPRVVVAPRQRRRARRRGGGSSPASRRCSACTARASTSSSTEAFSGCTSTRSPNSAAVSAVRGPIHAMSVRACGLPAIPTRLRTVEELVKKTASNPPVLIISRISAAGGAARTVRYAVTSSISHPWLLSPSASVSVAMSARGSRTRLTGSSTSSYGGNTSSSPRLDCSPDGSS